MAGGDKKKDNDQTFSFETVAVLVAVLKEKGGTLGMKEYTQMSSLDTSRSASGFDHLFRKVKARATELLEEKKAKGGDNEATTPKKTTGAAKNGTPVNGGSKSGSKRGKSPVVSIKLSSH